ncbi:winged helix-turn-helix domain-containing protein [Sphingomonas sp. Xoc002]|uniref:winged helix family transcriptional regulator n=1 Tax=Sphingomonas sp. Xoc002 TaxID=2837624 RepID=UPI003D185A5F
MFHRASASKDALALHHVTIATNRPDHFDTICGVISRYGMACRVSDCDENRPMPAIRDRPRGEDLLLIDQGAFIDDGLSFMLEALRHDPDRPVVLIGQDTTAVDRALILEMGADDYVDVNCDEREMIARLRAIIRRRRPAEEHNGPVAEQAVGFCEIAFFLDWRLDLLRRVLHRKGNESVILPPGEFAILLHLLGSGRRVVDRATLGGSHAQDGEDRRVDVLISRLRQKLESTEEVIRTVRGRGYLFLPEVRWHRAG